MKRILSIFLSAIIVAVSLFGFSSTAIAAVSGKCGDNASYTYDLSAGTLVISGTGDMYNYKFSSTENDSRGWSSADCINSIVSITVESGITSIGSYAFKGLTNVRSISIADTVKEIGVRAFDNCAVGADTVTVSIPASVESIGEYAFKGMSRVSAFSVSQDNKYYSSADGILYNKNKTKLIQAPCRISGENLTIPSTVTAIGADAFYKLQNVKNIVMPASVNTVGNNVSSVFSQCKYSITVYYSKSSAFEWNVYLKNIGVNGSLYPQITFEYADKSTTVKEYPPFTSGSDITAPSPSAPKSNGDKTHNIYSFPSAFEDATGDAVYTESAEIVSCSFDKYEITDSPTYTQDGKGKYTCTACGYYYEVTIPHNNCNHQGEIKTVNLKNATCTEGGYSGDLLCTVCNQYISTGEATLPNGHSLEKKVVNPTCTEQGYTHNICTVCNEEYNDSYTNALGHSYKTTVTKATTSKAGSTVVKCTRCQSVKSNVAIPKISSAALSTTVYVYNGKVKTPSVTVKDSKGKVLKKNTDYTVSYASGRKVVGKYAVKITFKGNYSGIKTLYFYVKPKGTEISSISARSKGFRVSWKTQKTQTTGYQIQYSTSSKFTNAKTITVTKNSNYAKLVSKLYARKKYYVRIRTYKNVKIDGKTQKLCSTWSKVKAVTTKK